MHTHTHIASSLSFYVNDSLNPQFTLSDDWKIISISTNHSIVRESSVWKQRQPIRELLTFESVTHWISYLAPRCGSKTCWTSATYTNENRSEGTVRCVSDIDHGLIGREKSNLIWFNKLVIGLQNPETSRRLSFLKPKHTKTFQLGTWRSSV